MIPSFPLWPVSGWHQVPHTHTAHLYTAIYTGTKIQGYLQLRSSLIFTKNICKFHLYNMLKNLDIEFCVLFSEWYLLIDQYVLCEMWYSLIWVLSVGSVIINALLNFVFLLEQWWIFIFYKRSFKAYSSITLSVTIFHHISKIFSLQLNYEYDVSRILNIVKMGNNFSCFNRRKQQFCNNFARAGVEDVEAIYCYQNGISAQEYFQDLRDFHNIRNRYGSTVIIS